MIPTARLLTLILLISAPVLTTESSAQDSGVLRRQERQAMLNWKADSPRRSRPHAEDALEFFQRLALDPTNDDEELPDDFAIAVECLSELERFPEFDAFLEDVLKVHADHWRLPMRAASILVGSAKATWHQEDEDDDATIQVDNGGNFIAGEFRRGDYSGDGDWINSTQQDRVRAIQLLLSAARLAVNDAEATPQERAGIYEQLADSLREVGYERFELEKLTDLQNVAKFASYEDAYDTWSSPRFQPGIAVDADGNPIFYQLPESWDSAKSDGERWRWAVNQLVAQDPSRQSEMDLEWAEILDSQFGVQANRTWGSWMTGANKDRVQQTIRQQSEASESDDLLFHEVPDTESMILTKTGIRRMTLPEEFNPIVILKRVIARDDAQKRHALSALASIRFGRHQYPQAAELLSDLLKKLDEEIGTPVAGQPDTDVSSELVEIRKTVQSGLDQILKGWTQFDASTVQISRRETTLDLKYRNAATVAIAASRIDIDALLNDVLTEMEGKPNVIPLEKTQTEKLASLLLSEDQKKYLSVQVASWDQTLTPPADHFDAVQTIRIPTDKPGAYWVTARTEDGNEDQIVLWVHDTAIVRKQLDSGMMYYVADAESGQPVANASLEFFGVNARRGSFRETRNVVETDRHAGQTDESGILIASTDSLKSNLNWMVIARTDDGRLAYSGFEEVWRSSRGDQTSPDPVRAFCMTDRPVYRPAQQVKFHIWMRQPGEVDEPSPLANRDFWLFIRDPRGSVVSESVVTSDKWGGIEGQWAIPANVVLGKYTIDVSITRTTQFDRSEFHGAGGLGGSSRDSSILGEGQFLVEEYRKPEFDVSIDLPQEPVSPGEKIQAVVSARYFFGEPVTQATVKYRVEAVDSDADHFPEAPWDWLYGNGYLWRNAKKESYSEPDGWRSQYGNAFEFRNPRSANSPELLIQGQGQLQDDGTFAIEIDSSTARQDEDAGGHYRVTAEVTDRSRRTITSSGDLIVRTESWQLFLRTDRGHYQPGDTATLFVAARTADGQTCRGRGTAMLISIQHDGDQVTKQHIAAVEIELDEQGNTSTTFVIPAAGQFELSAQLSDAEGHEQSGSQQTFVMGSEDDAHSAQFEALELIPDRPVYRHGETAVLQINTNQPDSTVLLFVRSLNGIGPKPIVVRLKGKSTTFAFDVLPQDIPAFFVEALTVADGRLHSAACRFRVTPDEHVAKVAILPAAAQYRPGEKAKVLVLLTDLAGRPFAGSTVLSVYDASLEVISPTRIPDIRSFFWNKQRSHYIQNQSTLDRLTDTSRHGPKDFMQQLETGHSGSYGLWFGSSGGSGGGFAGGGFSGGGFGGGGFGGGGFGGGGFGGGGFGGGGFGGGGFGGGGGLGGGGLGGGTDEPAASTDARNALTAVNDQAVTFAPTAFRSEFADTAFWTGTATSDANGLVEFAFTVPDNLTTWRVRVWALGDGTRVGSGVSQIISSKNLIIRPQVPRFFTETDRITISAVVHNYLDQAKTCRVVLDTEGREIQLPDDSEQTLMIPANGETRVDWNVSVVTSGLTKIRMKALTDEESDATELSVPVQVRGFLKKENFSQVLADGIASTSLQITVPEQRIDEQSRLEIRYCPSLAGTMVEALPFLIEYPHGCTEQTLNHFLPAVITRRTLQQTGIKLSDVKEQQQRRNPVAASSQHRHFVNPVFDEGLLNSYVSIGLDKLVKAQCSDGGWGWFGGTDAKATAHLTAQVVHGLQLANEAEVDVPDEAIDRGVNWLRAYQSSQLTLLRKGDRIKGKSPDPDAAAVGAPATSQTSTAKSKADETDALIAFVLSQRDDSDEAMNDYLCRDLNTLSTYSKVLTGLTLAAQNDQERLRDVLSNIRQFLEEDEVTQTAWLRTPGRGQWSWYDSHTETMARYLQLLLKAGEERRASWVVKYLLSNRRNGAWWDSTRDTALVIQALADHILLIGEADPNMTVEVLLDGIVKKQTVVTKGNIFDGDNVVLLEGSELTSGQHQIELRRTGTGRVYLSVQLTNFTKEDRLTAAGVEVKVERRYYTVIQDAANVDGQGDQNGVPNESAAKERRILIEDADNVVSGDLVEVELLIDSQADYEYMLLEDHKPSGFEAIDRLSGYTTDKLWAYRELRDDRVCYYLEHVAAGEHSVRYRLRAEHPGERIVALPATIGGMYSPDLAGNADEFRLKVLDGQ